MRKSTNWEAEANISNCYDESPCTCKSATGKKRTDVETGQYLHCDFVPCEVLSLSQYIRGHETNKQRSRGPAPIAAVKGAVCSVSVNCPQDIVFMDKKSFRQHLGRTFARRLLGLKQWQSPRSPQACPPQGMSQASLQSQGVCCAHKCTASIL